VTGRASLLGLGRFGIGRDFSFWNSALGSSALGIGRLLTRQSPAPLFFSLLLAIEFLISFRALVSPIALYQWSSFHFSPPS